MDSKLQIISGALRGFKLNIPSNVARPTQNKARGAIFNMLTGILDNDTEKMIVWDAFAGSGALGMEFLSRYENAFVIFSDNSPLSMGVVRKNLDSGHVDSKRYRLELTDAMRLVRICAPSADVIILDPPYDDAELGIKFVNELSDNVRTGTIVVQEIEKVVNYTPDTEKWEILRDKTYGRARFLILRRHSYK